MTRRIFIEETIDIPTGPGVREVWEPTDEEMAELGWVRDYDAVPAGTGINGEHAGIVGPCPDHTAPVAGCSSCEAWERRDARPEMGVTP